jgi:hypothetical protein
MSHVVTVQAKVRDPAAIAAACQRLGLAAPVQCCQTDNTKRMHPPPLPLPPLPCAASVEREVKRKGKCVIRVLTGQAQWLASTQREEERWILTV